MTRICLYRLLLILILVCPSTQVLAQSEDEIHGQAHARQLMSERRYSAALEYLQNLAPEQQKSAVIQVLIGRCQAKLERFDRAEKTFDDALKNAGDDVVTAEQARHLRWSVWLLRGDKDARERVEQEIEDLLNQRGDDVYALRTAYEGYSYLWRRKKQSIIVRQLAARAFSHPLRHQVSGLLYEESIAERDKKARREMLALYLKHYPHGREIYAASRRFLFESLSPDIDNNDLIKALQAVIDSYPDNPHLLQHAANMLISRDADLNQARTWLKHYQDRTQIPDEIRAGLFRTPGFWQKRYREEISEAEYLTGVIDFKETQYDNARARFEFVLKTLPEHGRVYYRLGQLALVAEDKPAALNHYRLALKLGGAFADTEDKLREILVASEAEERDPATYFAKHEGIIRFDNVTGSQGLSDISSQRIAWGDFNNDGFADILLDGLKVFKNSTGIGKGFLDVTESLGLSELKNHNGGLWIDYDNDGDLDLLLTRKKRAVHLLRNDNGENFVDVTGQVFAEIPDGPIEAAAWGVLP